MISIHGAVPLKGGVVLYEPSGAAGINASIAGETLLHDHTLF